MDTVVPPTSDDSASSVDVPFQHLQVNDASAGPGPGSGSGPTRDRLGVKRDFDENSSVAKRRKEFHPQVIISTPDKGIAIRDMATLMG